MTLWQLLTTTWHWEPSVVLGCAALMGLYLAATHGQVTLKLISFGGGTLLLLLALSSPLDTLSDLYLFSAHMVQHLLLVLIIPPLWLLGLPVALTRDMLRQPTLNRIERFLSRPMVAAVVGIVTLWLWHFPPLYVAAVRHLSLHIVMHLSLLVAATIVWWPVFGPLPERRLPPLTAALYLGIICAVDGLLGILLTFAPPLYEPYFLPFDTLRLLPLLRDQWGLTPEVDQQIGGLLMWIPGSLFYLTIIVIMLIRWFDSTSDADLSMNVTVT